MKGMAHWLKSSSKMKRWIFLILVGIILTCYGIAKILVKCVIENSKKYNKKLIAECSYAKKILETNIEPK